MRRIAFIAAVILTLSLVSSAGVTAQDESPPPFEMPTVAAPLDGALLQSLCIANAPDGAAMANCLDVVLNILYQAPTVAAPLDSALLQSLCLANAPDAAAMANCLGVVLDILALGPSPTGDYDLGALGQAYLLEVGELNARMADAHPGNERKTYRRQARALHEFITDVRALGFPLVLQVVVDRLVATNREVARLLRELARSNKEAPTYPLSQMGLFVATEAWKVASQELLGLLGLPGVLGVFSVPCNWSITGACVDLGTG